jgi:hypothetical protein
MLLDDALHPMTSVPVTGENPEGCIASRIRPMLRWLPRDNWQRLALGLWTLTLLVIAIRCLVTPHIHSVFPIFSNAARNWLGGTGLYSAMGDPYRYSPLVAVSFVPLSYLPDSLGGLIWRAVNVAVYLLAMAWWIRTVLPQALTARQRAILFILVLPLSVGSINNGQSNVLVIGLLLAASAAVADGRWNLASLAVTVACLFKVYPIAVGLLLAVAYPRRFAGRLVVGLIIGIALPFLFQTPTYVFAQYEGWLEHMRNDDRQGLHVQLWYRDLRLLCHIFDISLGPKSYMAIQLLAAAGIAVITVLGRLLWPQRLVLTTMLALACCWMTVLGSATESSTYILLAPSLAWSLLYAFRNPHRIWFRIGLCASQALFLLAQVAAWFPHGSELHSFGIHPLAALLFMGCIGIEAVRALGTEAYCSTACAGISH